MTNMRSEALAAGAAGSMPLSVGDITPSIDSFRRHLQASNAAPRTVTTYLEATGQFAAFLAAHGIPTDIADIRRQHVEAFLVDLLSRFSPATASKIGPSVAARG
jgi:hypothetical protein